MGDWNGVEELLGSLAEDDLATRGTAGRGGAGDSAAQRGDVRPTIVAFAGHEPLLLVRCRPFARGEAATALREVLDVALPAGADRIAAAFGGRARRLAAPDSPVARAAGRTSDVLLIVRARRRAAGIDVHCTLHTIEQGRRGPAIALGTDAAAPLGPLPQTLTSALATAPAPVPPAVLAARVHRVITLGHEVHVPERPPTIRDDRHTLVR